MHKKINTRRASTETKLSTRAAKKFVAVFTALSFVLMGCSGGSEKQLELETQVDSRTLQVSAATDRSNADSLDGTTVSGDVYVFVPQQKWLAQVRFFLDDSQRREAPYSTQYRAPFDLRGGLWGAANPWNTAELGGGDHTLSAALTFRRGNRTWNRVVHATFTVAGNARSPRPPSAETPENTNIIWTADHETGDFSQWEAGTGGYDGIWSSGNTRTEISTRYARSGRSSAALTVVDASVNNASGVRLAKTQGSSPPLSKEAYYSAWYYFPEQVQVMRWWNIFQFKQHGTSWGSDPTYTVNVENRADGSMNLYSYRHLGSDGGYMTRGNGVAAQASMSVPIGRWWHLECFYKWSRTDDGKFVCWQDGQLIWDLQSIQTEYDYDWPQDDRPYQWTVNNYTDGTSPSNQTIYVDDALISTTRVGPGTLALAPLNP